PVAPTSVAQDAGGLGGAVTAPSVTGVAGTTSVPGAATPDPAGGFLDTLGNAFGQLNGQLVSADAALADFAAGGSSDLHTVMLQMQEASLGLQLGVQVRDKFLEAYQEIMRLQL
ncbi:MAG TPA: flagellar hook-basal body complex protein FliE, partial [Candidatus Limnocylindrales bacterium]